MKIVLLTIGAACVVATASAQPLERLDPPGTFHAQTYSQAVKAGKLLFISGQVGTDETGKVVGPGMVEQLERLLANMAAVLKSQGADFSRIAKMTIYTTSLTDLRSTEVTAVRKKYFGDNRPASTLVQIQQLANPDFKIEVEAIAVLP
jgi:reactive intermediate/imine deaminase